MSKQQSNSKSKPKRTRRSFTDEFKIEAVKIVTEQGYKASEVARNLDINENLIHRCKIKFSQPESDTEHEASNFAGFIWLAALVTDII